MSNIDIDAGAWPMQLNVECDAGYRGEREPRAFFLGQRRVEILRIVDRWIASDHRYFKVESEDRATYILRHDELSGAWTLTLFQAAART